MCTVTYLPLPSKGFVLTSSRDEKSIRKPALPPEEYQVHDRKVLFPRDQDAGGTWIAADRKGYSLCLLNGGFKIHESKPPYRMSRGLVLLDFFRYNEVAMFRNNYDFSGIEPFTLLVIGFEERSLDELRWDGREIHHKVFNPEVPEIWSSVTLYTDEVIQRRQKWFQGWLLDNPTFHPENAIGFHKKAGTGDIRNDVLMNRENEIRTVSITSILRSNSVEEIHYQDIIASKSYHHNISGETLFFI